MHHQYPNAHHQFIEIDQNVFFNLNCASKIIIKNNVVYFYYSAGKFSATQQKTFKTEKEAKQYIENFIDKWSPKDDND